MKTDREQFQIHSVLLSVSAAPSCELVSVVRKEREQRGRTADIQGSEIKVREPAGLKIHNANLS